MQLIKQKSNAPKVAAAAEEAKDKVSDKASELTDKASDKASELTGKASDLADKAKSATQGSGDADEPSSKDIVDSLHQAEVCCPSVVNRGVGKRVRAASRPAEYSRCL